MLNTIERETDSVIKQSIIWLHGLGATADDFLPLVSILEQRETRFIFPQAPSQPVTINMGYVMPAWYDIFSLDRESVQDKVGIEQSSAGLMELIEQEHRRGVPYEDILLIGFSQGGAIALHTGLHCPHPLAGVVGLSTYLPLGQELGQKPLHPHALPILLMHGIHDSVLPLDYAKMAQTALEEHGFSSELKIYAMEHHLCPEQIEDLKQWLAQLKQNKKNKD